MIHLEAKGSSSSSKEQNVTWHDINTRIKRKIIEMENTKRSIIAISPGNCKKEPKLLQQCIKIRSTCVLWIAKLERKDCQSINGNKNKNENSIVLVLSSLFLIYYYVN